MKWEVKKLRDVCEIVTDTPPEYDGEKDYFSTGAISNDEFDLPEKVTYKERPSRANSYPKTGDVGFAKMKFTNKVLLINSKLNGSIFSTGFCFLRPNNSLDYRYLFQFIISHSFQKLKDLYASDGIMGGIKNSDVRQIEIPVPPLSEQKRIVALLDKALESIAKAKENAEKNLKNAKKVFESYLQKVFENKGEEWEEKKLEEICTKITDGVHKKPKYVSEGIPFIKINNLTDGPKISFKNVSYITKKDHELFCKRTKPEKGDILITKDGTIGIIKVIDTDIEFSIFVSVALIKPLSKEITSYLKYVLMSPIIQNQIKPKGTALKHLYLKDLRNYMIPIAPLSEQMKIVFKLDELYTKTQALDDIYNQKFKVLEELKQSILQKAFKGELTEASA